MEVDSSVDCIFPEPIGSLGVNHHSSSLLGDGTDNSLYLSILVLRVRRARFIYCTTSIQHRAVVLVVILPWAIIAPKASHLITQRSDSGPKCLVGGDASFRLVMWEHP